MYPIPREPVADATLSLLSEGYRYISRRCESLDSDIFQTRLMMSPAICMMGEEAASVFYAPGRFVRKHAMPPTALRLLQDVGSVQLQEGAEHLLRKQLFMSFMTRDAMERLMQLSAAHWRARFRRWESLPQVVLLEEAEAVLCRAVCAWSGLTLTEREASRRTAEFSAMIDGAGAVGPRNWRGMLRRARTERWARGVIDAVRNGGLRLAPGSPAEAIARFAGSDGRVLDSKTAAIELINLLRPTVAVARYIVFAALALHAFPACRRRLLGGDEDYLDMFVQEVRRYYPFFPAVGGIVDKAFDWRGMHFEKGTWVLLDLYGTNHDGRLWEEPFAFMPERFAQWKGSAHSLIPQGAGDFFHGHRCPGEWITIELVKTAVRLLLHEVRYEVPRQDLRVDLGRMPAMPASGFIIGNARRTGLH
ncbi:cytochrome P450 [Noviherbaspirillum aridicola]|uniref:Fatty-acid peroxygenase n=1 Tax=Noviherbaspirillum aridicola TaxID=2849687 RepID=A0ABQ4Q6R6_9BURK|nr:cytochrome P450 [Noviherbaspirillum aridicola]GIZ52828.1 fatty-acid peroxygenase [Noviherbaspirillum aridicola]